MATRTASLPDPLYDDLHTFMREWNAGTMPTVPHLASLATVQAHRRAMLVSLAPAIRQIVTQALDLLADSHPTTSPPRILRHPKMASDILRLRFIEGLMSKEVLSLPDYEGVSLWMLERAQQEALQSVVGLLREEDDVLRQKHRTHVNPMLPRTGTLFGVTSARQTLGQWLTAFDADALPIVVVSGLGGVGKTTLAAAAAWDVAGSPLFDRVEWITLPATEDTGKPLDVDQIEKYLVVTLTQRFFPGELSMPDDQRTHQIRHALRTIPTLVIIDNIEYPDITPLLGRLATLATPSKFLLTSRAHGYHEVAHTYDVPELSFDDAVALLQYEARRQRVTDLIAGSETLFNDVYAVTGGNPLALVLTVSMAQTIPIHDVLTHIRSADTHNVVKLYRRIYHYLWQSLSEPAQKVLLTIAAVAVNGATLPQIRAASGLVNGAITEALMELRRRALLTKEEERDGIYYRMHRLTEQFLRLDIAKLEE